MNIQKKGAFMNIIKALLALSISLSVCIAQDINISGKVTDTNGNSIEGAIVWLVKYQYKDTTDANGDFTLTGAIGINDQINQQITYKLSATIKNSLLFINIQEKSAVEITTYSLQGKVISSINKTMDAGTHSIPLSHVGAGVYLYKIKSGRSEFVLKSYSIDKVSDGAVASSPDSSSSALVRYAISKKPINDIIIASKLGYLNNRIEVTNSDTSGILMKMILQDAGTVTDIDGNVYHAIKIGNQVWTVENFRTTKFNDGTSIPYCGNDTLGPQYAYYNNTTNADSIAKFGALYNWYAVNTGKLAIDGWHVPTHEEWEELKDYLVANGYSWGGVLTTVLIGKSLAAQTDWKETGIGESFVGNNLSSNNSTGFTGLPGGYLHFFGDFSYIGETGWWWSSTEDNAEEAYYSNLDYYSGHLMIYTDNKELCYSVRLLRD